MMSTEEPDCVLQLPLRNSNLQKASNKPLKVEGNISITNKGISVQGKIDGSYDQLVTAHRSMQHSITKPIHFPTYSTSLEPLSSSYLVGSTSFIYTQPHISCQPHILNLISCQPHLIISCTVGIGETLNVKPNRVKSNRVATLPYRCHSSYFSPKRR